MNIIYLIIIAFISYPLISYPPFYTSSIVYVCLFVFIFYSSSIIIYQSSFIIFTVSCIFSA
ncbi:hypothetical protein BCR42DRAFT_43072 [Absidia repens]|uniref:Uncharacterized protein n=1 Tax=Absidia repens TaxID=90262 RepID=A0A1X2IG82_9FUNG|nr:hypothetical protein BCR42DRAFT_43072 [Absidia repens]